MANLPNLTVEDIGAIVPQATSIEVVGSGGQKLVFRAILEDAVYALKFARVPPTGRDEPEDFATSDIAIRAKREVETMHDCESPFMVKLGPLGLSFPNWKGQQLVFFSEEYIDGQDLMTVIRDDGRLTSAEVAKLGRQIGEAIKALWELGKIHRDIKPANIMRRRQSGDFVLLDAGFAFDLEGESISVGPVGTPKYFSPEQFDFENRRTVLDFRSDLFSLGVTMYYLVSGRHPFWSPGDNTRTIYSKITGEHPMPPSHHAPGIPPDLDEVILRLLGKSPHLRYRKCDQLLNALQGM